MFIMIKQDENFLRNITEKMGKEVGEKYTNWHDLNSTELSYKWLKENNYTIDSILDSKYQKALSIYLICEFVDWFGKQLNEG